jgi:hypothetical protein
MAPFLKETLPPLESFANDVNRLSRVLRAKDIRMVGGEPLLHPDIVRIPQDRAPFWYRRHGHDYDQWTLAQQYEGRVLGER